MLNGEIYNSSDLRRRCESRGHRFRSQSDAEVMLHLWEDQVRAKMADAVALTKLSGPETVDWALGHATVYGRFAEGDLASIIAHRAAATPATPPRPARPTASMPAPTPGKGWR